MTNTINHRSFKVFFEEESQNNIDEGIGQWAKNAALAGSLMAGGIMGSNYFSGQPSTQQNTQQSVQQSQNTGFSQIDNNTYKYVSDQPTNPKLGRAIEMKAMQEFMRATGSNMQGVQWAKNTTPQGKIEYTFKTSNSKNVQPQMNRTNHKSLRSGVINQDL